MCVHGEPSLHPEPAVIADYCRGRVSGAAVADIEAHLKYCPRCRRAITVRVRDDAAHDREPFSDKSASGER